MQPIIRISNLARTETGSMLFKVCITTTLVYMVFTLTSGDPDRCGDGLKPCNKSLTMISTVVPTAEKPVRPPPSHNNNKSSKSPENYFLVPPFLIGACTVVVLYVIFHCIYMHCYTERRVQAVTRKAQQRTPTIIIHDEPNSSSSKPFTPMVRVEKAGYGQNEILQTQPFLLCQPLDMDEEESDEQLGIAAMKSRRHSSLRKSIQSLQVPNIFGKRKSFSAGTSLSLDNDVSPSSDKKSPNLERTRASICFVPVGKTISDASNTSPAEWTPLQGFVYSSFILPRNPSYKNACGATSDTSISSTAEAPDQHGSFIVLPRRASYCRSMSQSSAASLGEEGEELLGIGRQNGAVRHNSRVSFSFNVDQQLKEEEEEEKEESGNKNNNNHGNQPENNGE